MAKKQGFELLIYHCYSCGEFRVRVKSGKSKTFEPCPKCSTLSIRAMPHALDIELTNRCGGACIMCPRGSDDFSRKIGDMSKETFASISNEIAFWNRKQPGTVRLAFLHMFGESVGHPHFVEWVNRLSAPVSDCICPSCGHKAPHETGQLCYHVACPKCGTAMNGGAGIGTLIVSTNGMPLNDRLTKDILASGLHRLIVSLDGVSKETLEAIRPGVKFDRVQKNVDDLLRFAKQRSALGRHIPSIWLQILKLNKNEHEWLPMVRKYTQSPRIRTVSPKGRQYREIPGVPGGKVFCKSVEALAGQYAGAPENRGWDGANRRRISCDKPFKRASIWWDGTVPSPACCYTANATGFFGVIGPGKNSLHGIWLGKKFQNVRREFARYQKSDGREGILPELCRNC